MTTENPYQAPQVATEQPYYAGPQQRTLGWLLFQFDGRIPRRAYWGVGLAMGAIFAVLYMAILIPAIAAGENAGGIIIAGLVVMAILYIPMVWISFAVVIKRFHDRGKSGWWSLIGLIPYLGALWLFIDCGCLRGTHGPNQYGPDPT